MQDKGSEHSLSELEIEARMRPGAFSRSGFLGAGDRLAEVLAHDRQTLCDLGLSVREIASALESLIVAAELSPSRQSQAGPIVCRLRIHQGFQLCPWTLNPNAGQCKTGGGVRHASVDWHITNTETQAEMVGPGLIVHLIRDHAFFEGPGSPNRVDPARLAEVLGLI